MLDSEVTLEHLEEQNFPTIIAVSSVGSIIEVLQMTNNLGIPNPNYMVISEFNGWSTDEIMEFLDICRESGYSSLVDCSMDIHNFIYEED